MICVKKLIISGFMNNIKINLRSTLLISYSIEDVNNKEIILISSN